MLAHKETLFTLITKTLETTCLYGTPLLFIEYVTKHFETMSLCLIDDSPKNLFSNKFITFFVAKIVTTGEFNLTIVCDQISNKFITLIMNTIDSCFANKH